MRPIVPALALGMVVLNFAMLRADRPAGEAVADSIAAGIRGGDQTACSPWDSVNCEKDANKCNTDNWQAAVLGIGNWYNSTTSGVGDDVNAVFCAPAPDGLACHKYYSRVTTQSCEQ